MSLMAGVFLIGMREGRPRREQRDEFTFGRPDSDITGTDGPDDRPSLVVTADAFERRTPRDQQVRIVRRYDLVAGQMREPLVQV